MQFGEILSAFLGYFGSVGLVFIGLVLWFKSPRFLKRNNYAASTSLYLGSSAILLFCSWLLLSGKAMIHYQTASAFQSFFGSTAPYMSLVLLSAAVNCAALLIAMVLYALFHDWQFSRIEAKIEDYLAKPFVLVPSIVAIVLDLGLAVWLSIRLFSLGLGSWILPVLLVSLILGVPEYFSLTGPISSKRMA